jgi:hypothetical protein
VPTYNLEASDLGGRAINAMVSENDNFGWLTATNDIEYHQVLPERGTASLYLRRAMSLVIILESYLGCM